MVAIPMPEKPEVPSPPALVLLLGVVALVYSQVLFFIGTTRFVIFMSGSFSTLGGAAIGCYINMCWRARKARAEIDLVWSVAQLRIAMFNVLVERHGPEQTVHFMNFADQLVQDGDFPTMSEAINALERWQDMEPTPFEEDA